jgi:acetate kinase
MHILVVNSGSSSIKFSFFETGAGEPACKLDGEISGFGGESATLVVKPANCEEKTSTVKAETPEDGIHAVVDALDGAKLPATDAVGYRVVHPGAKLDRHTRITSEVLQELDAAGEFAPLHDPVVVTIIRAMMVRLPQLPHFACFDTVFHETMPVEATTYPVPKRFREQGVKRYGFHGLSCESIVRQMRHETRGFPHRTVIAHLGSGCSVTALMDGRSIDTTMGLTPTGGVVMGTRPGDLDPGLILYLLRQTRQDASALEKMLNHDCGMVALSGMKNDVKALRAAGDNANAQLALNVFTRSVRKAMGSYAWLLGGLDAVIFAGGIGEHDAATRSEVLKGLEGLGIRLEGGGAGKGMRRVSAADSQVAVWVVPADEDRMIAVHVAQMSAQTTSENASTTLDGVMG